MEVLQLPPVRGPRLSVWRSSFAHPRKPHLTAIRTHWFNYKAQVFCPVVNREGRSEETLMADVNALFAPSRNAGRREARYWDLAHAGGNSRPDEEDGPFFYLLRCQLIDLLHPNFIARYMKTGKFTAISVGVNLSTHNVAAVVPLGGEGKATLVLSVDKDTYEQLGLEGKHSFFKKSQRYNIHIDLCAPHFVPGKKFFERVRWCLTERLTDVELLASWTVDGKSRKMEFATAVKAKPLKLKEASQVLTRLNVPILDELVLAEVFAVGEAASSSTTPHAKLAAVNEDFIKLGEEESDDDEEKEEKEEAEQREAQERLARSMNKMTLAERRKKKSSTTSDDARAFLGDIYEYLGLVHNAATRLICSNQTDEPEYPFVNLDRFQRNARAGRYEWCGLITHSFIEDLLSKAQKLVNDKVVPWAALTVIGFENAPLSWDKNEHGAGDVLPGGENDYTFVLLPNDQYWLYSAIGKSDTYSG